MANITLGQIHDKLENIESEIKELKKSKVGTDIWQLQLEVLKNDVKDVKKDIDAITGYGRWAVLLILGLVITAIVNVVLK
jgi:hypothetical protein